MTVAVQSVHLWVSCVHNGWVIGGSPDCVASSGRVNVVGCEGILYNFDDVGHY